MSCLKTATRPRLPQGAFRQSLTKKKIETAAEAKPDGFVEVKLAAPGAEAARPGIELILAGERRLRVEAGFDRELLLAVVAALEGER